MQTLLPGEKKKYLSPTARKEPRFEELQKVRQGQEPGLLQGGLLADTAVQPQRSGGLFPIPPLLSHSLHPPFPLELAHLALLCPRSGVPLGTSDRNLNCLPQVDPGHSGARN